MYVLRVHLHGRPLRVHNSVQLTRTLTTSPTVRRDVSLRSSTPQDRDVESMTGKALTSALRDALKFPSERITKLTQKVLSSVVLQRKELEVDAPFCLAFLDCLAAIKDVQSAKLFFYWMKGTTPTLLNAEVYSKFVSLCKATNALDFGREIHLHLTQSSPGQIGAIANDLVFMYAKCGDMDSALSLFRGTPKLLYSSTATYNSLISSCIESDAHTVGPRLFEEMLKNGIRPDAFTYEYLFTLYSGSRNPYIVNKITNFYLSGPSHNFRKETVVALIKMQGRVNGFESAKEVLKKASRLRPKSIVAIWNDFLHFFEGKDNIIEAYSLFEDMIKIGITPNALTYIHLLSLCARKRSEEHVQKIEASIFASPYASLPGLPLMNVFLDFTGKCKGFQEALTLFRKFQEEKRPINGLTWNVMLSVCAYRRKLYESLGLLHEMKLAGFAPTEATYVSMLNVCAITKSFDIGMKIFEEIPPELTSNPAVIGAQINLYGKCRKLQSAIELFWHYRAKGIVFSVGNWNSLLALCEEEKNFESARSVFLTMQRTGTAPTKGTFSIMFNLCSLSTDKKYAQEILKEATNFGFLKDPNVLACAIKMQAKLGGLARTLRNFDIFKGAKTSNIVLWNAMFGVYRDSKDLKRAQKLYGQMKNQGVVPISSTFSILFSLCTETKAIEFYRQILSDFNKTPYSKNPNTVLIGSMIAVAGECDSLEAAERTFRENIDKNRQEVALWNSMLSVCASHQNIPKATQFFEEMKSEGVSPNDVTFVILLTLATRLKDSDFGVKVRSYIEESPIDYSKFPVLLGALVNMSGRCEGLGSALAIVSKLDKSSFDEALYNILISLCVEESDFQEATKLFMEMQRDDVSPSVHVFSSLLKLCAKKKSLRTGKNLHSYIASLEEDIIENPRVSSALVTMYGKCEGLASAQAVFRETRVTQKKETDILVWNALLTICLDESNVLAASKFLQEIESENVAPDEATFSVLYSLCAKPESHSPSFYKSVRSQFKNSAIQNSKNNILRSSLLRAVAKYEGFQSARALFRSWLTKEGSLDPVLWSYMVSISTDANEYDAGIDFFLELRSLGVSSTEDSWRTVMHSCALSQSRSNSEKLRKLFSESPFFKTKTPQLIGAFVSMCSKCEGLDVALKVFEEKRKIVRLATSVWNVIFQACSDVNNVFEAMRLWEMMAKESIAPDEITYTILFSLCARQKNWEFGEKVHSTFMTSPFLDLKDNKLLRSLIMMHGECQGLESARQIFFALKAEGRPLGSGEWLVPLSLAYRSSNIKEGMKLLDEIVADGILLDENCYYTLFSLCARTKSLAEGEIVFQHLVAFSPKLSENDSVASAVVSWIGATKGLDAAVEYFKKLKEEGKRPGVNVWNVLFRMCATQRKFGKAVQLFEEMKKSEISPNFITYITLFNFCARRRLLQPGKNIHTHFIENYRDPSPKHKKEVVASLVKMYAACGCQEEAAKLCVE